MDKLILIIKKVITYGRAEEGGDDWWTSGKLETMFLDLSDSYTCVAL